MLSGLRVFLSHAGADRAPVAQVHGWLAEAGHSVFLDRHPTDGITPGEEWERALHERLRRSDAVVCVVTRAFLESRWCTAEVAIARSRGIPVLPVTAEPGARHELVASLHAVDLVTDPEAAGRALAAALDRIRGTLRRGWPDDQCPFPGLRAFESDEHLAFFGRDADVDRIVRLLRSAAEQAERAALVVVGPSGCGKSSIVRAGVLPRIEAEDGWCALSPIRPGADPVEALCAVVTTAAAGLGWTLADVRERLTADAAALVGDLLLADPAAPRRHLLLVVDQFEELLTLTPAAERARFAALLGTLLAGPVRVLATIRPEFLDRLLDAPELRDLATTIHPVTPLGREALREVVEGPAALWNLVVPDELVSALVDDTGSGAAMPLLAFALARLTERARPGDELTVAAYRELGGVAGALTAQGDAALAEAARAGRMEPGEVVDCLLNLVSVDSGGTGSGRPVPLDEVPGPTAEVLAVFVSRRLLVTTTGADDRTAVSLAHETLLTAWTPLREAIAAAATAIRARGAVHAAAVDWEAHDRPRDRLWERGRLAAALSDLGMHRRGLRAAPAARPRVTLPATGSAFLDASVRRDVLLRSRLIAVLSVLVLVATTFAAFAVDRSARLDAQLRLAEAQILADTAAVRDTADPVFAAKLALSAWRANPTNPAARHALLAAYLDLRSVDAVFEDLTDSPIEAVEATADGRTVLLDLPAGASVVTDLLGPQPAVWPVPGAAGTGVVTLSPGGRWVVAAVPADGTVLVWDTASRSGPLRLPVGDIQPDNLSVSPDDRQLLVTVRSATGATLSLWDLATGRQLAVPPHLGRDGPLLGALFTADPGRVLLLVDGDGRDEVLRFVTRSLVDEDLRIVLLEVEPTLSSAPVLDDGRVVVVCESAAELDGVAHYLLVDTATGAAGSTIPLFGSYATCSGALDVSVTSDQMHLLVGGPIGPEPEAGTVRMIGLRDGAAREFAIPRTPPTAEATDRGAPAVVTTPGGPPTVLIPRGPAVLAVRATDPSPLEVASTSTRVTSRLSEDGRYAVISDGRTLSAVDRATGALLGRADHPTTYQAAQGISVSHEVAIAEQRSGGWTLTTYPLPSLNPSTTRPLAGPAEFTGSDHLSFGIDADRTVALIGGTLSVLDSRTGEPLGPPLQVTDPEDRASAQDLRSAEVLLRPGHPDEVAVVVPDHPVRLWSLSERRAVATIPSHPLGYAAGANAAFDPAGRQLAVLTTERTIEVWDVDRAMPVGRVPLVPENSVLIGFSGDGYLLTRNVGRVEFWDVEQGVRSGAMDIPYAPAAGGPLVRGSQLVVGGHDAMQIEIPVSAATWAEQLCRALPQSYSDRQRALLSPAGDPVPPCPA